MRRSRAPSKLLSPGGGGGAGAGSSGGDGSMDVASPSSSCWAAGGPAAQSRSSQEMKRANTAALRQGSVSVVRAPLLGCLSVPRGGGLVVGAFKLPGGARRTEESEGLLRRKSLGVRRPVTFMTSSKFRRPSPPDAKADGDFELKEGEEEEEGGVEAAAADEADTFEPLVLWEAGPEENDHRISVDPRLCKWLRPHQREGVQFMFECVMGMREFEGSGCILADDMGLGKTLQSITVLWTLLKQGKAKGKPAVRRAIVVCPTSLVKNWEAEIEKWLKGDCRVIALSETTRQQVVQSINLFLASMIYRVLIVSYETFRLHSKLFYAKADTCCDLLICDEAHRLKNADTATNQALAALKCRKRVLLSGTPMQNDLEEFYAMTDFTNPGVLGSGSSFRKKFLAPILAGREPSATDKQVERAQKCQNEMSTVVNEFILRRTNNINAKHLPPKLVQVVCCRLTPVQKKIYKHLMSSKEIRHILNGKQTNILSSIGAIKKLCNHPKLLLEGASGKDGDSGQAKIASMLPTESSSLSSSSSMAAAGGGGGGRGMSFGRRGGGGMQKGVFPEWSGKMETLFRLMREMRNTGDDRIVVVSNFTSSLDLIGSMCRENSWPFVRLDGSTGVSKRQKLVDAFNEPGPQSFAFLLSSKAGGCGLNLIGGNRLVLFDPDWNPAVDKQAAARVWRDGQKKRCYVYRFVSTGTIEEKVFQRQLSKEGLQNIVDDKEEVNSLSSKDLKDLFRLYEGTPSDTHDKLRCKRCRIDEAVQAVKDIDEAGLRRALPQQLALCEELLSELSVLPEGATFMQQWDPEEENVTAENYANAVHEPMDFTKIASKLRASISALRACTSAAPAPVATPEEQRQQQDGAGGGGSDVRALTVVSIKGNEDCRHHPVPSSGGEGGEGEEAAAATVPSPDAAGGGSACDGAGAGGAAPYANVPAFTKDMRLVFENVRRLWPHGSIGGDNHLTKAADSLKTAFEARWEALAPRVHSIQREALEAARREAKDKEEQERGEDWVPPPKFQEQMGMPKEEDLNSWSHHYSTDTTDDPVFRGAMMGTGDSLVSFVFGLEVTWDLLQVQLEEEAEARTLEIKLKTDARAARAADKAASAARDAAAAAGSSNDDDDGIKDDDSGDTTDKNKKKKKKPKKINSEGGGGGGADSGGRRRRKGAAAAGGGADDNGGDGGGILVEDRDGGGGGGDGGGKEVEVEVKGERGTLAEEDEEEEDDGAWMHDGAGVESGGPATGTATPGGGGGGGGGRRRRVMEEDPSDNDDGYDDDGEEAAAGGDTQVEEPPVPAAGTPGGGVCDTEEDEVMETPPLLGTVEAAEEEDWRVPKSGESAAREMAAATTPAAGGEVQSSPFQSPPCQGGTVDGGEGRADGSRISAGAKNKTEWQCSACTFANPASKRKCTMCTMGSRPPGMGRSQPLSPRPPGDTNRERGQERSSSSGAQKKKSKKDGKDKKGKSSDGKKKRKREIWVGDDDDDDDDDFE